MLSQSKITYLVLLLIAFLSLPAFSQDTVTIKPTRKNRISLAPIGLVNKVRIKYERLISPTTSLGLEASIYTFDPVFSGIQAPLVLKQIIVRAKAYRKKHQFEGIYLMAQSGLAYHTFTAYDEIYLQSSPGLFSLSGNFVAGKEFQVQSHGLVYGLAIGYQEFLDQKNKYSVDIYIGFKDFILNNNINEYITKKATDTEISFNLFRIENPYDQHQFKKLTSAGSPLVLGLNFGYHF